MRILQVAHYFLPKHRAGVEVYTYNLSKELQRNHDVCVYCREDGYFDKEYHETDEDYNGLKVKRIFYNGPLTLEKTYKNELIDKHFNSFLGKIKPDIVHFQHLERISVTMIDVAKQKGIPSVLTLHDYWFICPLIRLLINGSIPCPTPYSEKRCVGCIKAWLRENNIAVRNKKIIDKGLSLISARTQLMRRMLSKVDTIIAPSEFLKERFIEYGIPEERIVYLEHGADTKKFAAFDRIPSQKIRFGFIGSIMKYKGLHLLLDAFKKFEYDDVALKIFGKSYDGYSKTLLESIRKDKRIEYSGEFDNENAVSVYSQFDVLVIPSIWYENSPLVIQEAFLANTPVIAAKIGALAEKIQVAKNGLLFDLDKKDDLYRKLKLIVSDRSLIEKLSKNIKPVKDIGRQAIELNRIYKLISKNRKREQKISGPYSKPEGKTGHDEKEYIDKIKQFNLNLLRESLGKGNVYLKTMPVDMSIETTLQCNLKCKICQREGASGNAFLSKMKPELFKRIAKECFIYLKNVSLSTIGEPLLTENLYEILDIIKEYSVGLELITNGTLLNNDDLIMRFLDVLNYMNISWDAATEKTYQEIRRGGDFNAVIQNVKRFNELKQKKKATPLLSFSFVAMRSNIEELPLFVSFAKRLGADIVYVSHLRVYHKKMANESLIYYKEVANRNFLRAMDEARRLNMTLILPKLYKTESNSIWAKRLPIINENYTLREKVVFNSLYSSRVCKFLWAKPFIAANGDVTPCCGSADKPVMGNILKQPLREIWNNSIYLKMRQSFFTGRLFDCCRNCPMKNPGMQVNKKEYFMRYGN